MKTPKLTITVEGDIGTGKTTVGREIVYALKRAGFANTVMVDNLQGENLEQLVTWQDRRIKALITKGLEIEVITKLTVRKAVRR